MDYLFIERAVDENNEPMLYAEYWGYVTSRRRRTGQMMSISTSSGGMC
jgi:hypothetical protein